MIAPRNLSAYTAFISGDVHPDNTPHVFPPTDWSLVLSAGKHDTTRAQTAFSILCQNHWFPIYAHARRRGCGPHDAEDLTQAFFAQLLERQAIAAADPERGRFRSFSWRR